MESLVAIVKDIVNIIFFAVTATVTVFSYLHARKTLFAPIRTETFKLQLKALEEVLALFQDKTETDFHHTMDLPRILSLNALKMADAYTSRFFKDEIKIDKEKRRKRYEPLIGVVVSAEHVEEYFEEVGPGMVPDGPDSPEKRVTNPAIILANWQKFDLGMIGFTRQYQDRMKDLERLASSPLFPAELRERIRKFRNACQENLSLMRSAITACALEMPEHFPIASDMERFNTSWVWNRFNAGAISLEPLARDILDYVNDYLKIESIMK